MSIQGFLGFARNDRRRIVVVERPRLTEGELKLAFTVASDNRLWLGVMQLIDQLRDEAISASRLHIGNTPVSASFTGGHEHLELLRERMIAYREAAIRMSPEQIALVMAQRSGPDRH